jgi:hypothetical protein
MPSPRVEQLDLPPDYGSPSETLDWDDVRKKLEDAFVYWVASTRPDGRPHVVPRDGIWLDDTWYYGGSPDTVHNHNIESNPRVVMHIGEGLEAVIVEGESHHFIATPELANELAAAQNRKYPQYGKAEADTYLTRGVLAVRARRVLAWTNLPVNATRFVFT